MEKLVQVRALVVFIVVRKEIMILTKQNLTETKRAMVINKILTKVKLAAPLPSPKFKLPSVQWFGFLNTKNG